MRRPLLFPRQGRPGVRRPLLVAAAVTAAAAVAAPAAQANHHACPVLRVKDGDTLSWSRNNCLNQHALYPIGGPKSPLPSGAAIPIADIPGDVMLVTPELPNLGAQGDLFPAMDPLNDYGPSFACIRPNLGSDPDNPGDPPTPGPEPDNDQDDDGFNIEGLGHDFDGILCGPTLLAGIGGILPPLPPLPGLPIWGCRDSASS